jgi:hypothetical protein
VGVVRTADAVEIPGGQSPIIRDPFSGDYVNPTTGTGLRAYGDVSLKDIVDLLGGVKQSWITRPAMHLYSQLIHNDHLLTPKEKHTLLVEIEDSLQGSGIGRLVEAATVVGQILQKASEACGPLDASKQVYADLAERLLTPLKYIGQNYGHK